MSEPRSVAALLRFDGAGLPIMAKGGLSLQGEWLWYAVERYVTFLMIDENAGAYIGQRATVELPDGIDFAIAATYDGSGTAAGVKLYVDGELVTSAAVTHGTYVARQATTYPYTLGYFSGGRANAFNGRIIVAMVSDAELTALDVAALARRMRSTYGIIG